MNYTGDVVDMNIEERVRTLENLAELKNLRSRYCYLLDEGDTDAWLSLFTEDATIVSESPRGEYNGHDELSEMITNIHESEDRRFTKHVVYNPIIDVTGDRATGRWSFEALIQYNDETMLLIKGEYDEKYRLVEDEWKFTTITISFDFRAEFDDGWSIGDPSRGSNW
jgi:3-phenylpropionate/cinnamic acid dioxygenase small subunit